QTRVAINPGFDASGVFPKTEHVDCGGAIRVMLLGRLTEGRAGSLPIRDRRVQPMLRMKVLSAKQGIYARELALDLFAANRLVYETRTCREPVYPCGSTDPRRLTEVMF